jgi:hypothetical protein
MGLGTANCEALKGISSELWSLDDQHVSHQGVTAYRLLMCKCLSCHEYLLFR